MLFPAAALRRELSATNLRGTFFSRTPIELPKLETRLGMMHPLPLEMYSNTACRENTTVVLQMARCPLVFAKWIALWAYRLQTIVIRLSVGSIKKLSLGGGKASRMYGTSALPRTLRSLMRRLYYATC